ncbi:hypothetical protein NDU88_005247 [Pleurodeles waltl]|uniref:C3H1-type domain-containing protein n=1 Tax=Pleurodeles waltl TaxID=8319 RepID=A0AAV7PF57_PLEWA|nr:hypothetical protein NDU88_005247 [Pleurodeles waltl]
MASNRARVGKRKGTDPELAQLLKLVLAKLGGGDSDGEAAPSDGDDGEEGTSSPRRTHVAPPAAFPPVKRRNKKQTGGAVVQQPTLQTVPAPPPPMIELVTVVAPSIAAAAPSEEIAGPRPGVATPSPGPAGGVEAMLADIRRSVAALAAPTKDLPTQVLPIVQGVAPGASTTTEQGQAAMAQSGASQDLTTQTLVSVSQILANITVPTTTPPPTTPWASDPLQNTVLKLKRQVEALVAARNVPSLQMTTSSPCVSQAPGSLSQTPPVEKEHGKAMEQGVSIIKTPAPAEGTDSDTLLSRPGKLAAHVASEIKEKIWKGDFVDIFSLVRAKSREIESKDKDAKASSFTDKKPKIEENITNCLFGFNVFMSVMMEKKPEIGMSMIFYANKILKAHHTYGGNAWLEYDRDFRWAKLEDPAIGWDQTEVNVWLECVNNKLPSKQLFRAQYSNDKKRSCWAFNRKVCSHPPGTCKFRHSCAFCGHPSHPEFKCLKKPKDKAKEGSESST